MLIHAPTHFMVLSIILTNRVNKTLTPRRSAMRKARDGRSAPMRGTASPQVSSPRRGEETSGTLSASHKPGDQR
ncbi:hypothetical protein DQE84_18695 [Staphylococcus warneri]|nr:hypothetical protein DQE84_18695 [Staphylococcus warneri]